MLEKLTYQNHLNETFDFGKDGIYVNAGELHNYAWSVEKRNNRISALRRDIVTTRKLPVIIICQDEAAAIAARNKLFETVEKDVLAGEYGKIILNGYYFRCFVTQSKKKDYLKSGSRYMQLDLVLTTDRPVWVKEVNHYYEVVAREKLVEATNVLKGMTFEVGDITTDTGENNDSITTNIRSSMVDISSLQATTSTTINYLFAVYSIDGDQVLGGRLARYGENDEYVSSLDLLTNYNEQYGYPEGTIAAFFSYNMYTTIKKCRFAINPGNSGKIRVAIYKIVDGAAQIVDQCDVIVKQQGDINCCSDYPMDYPMDYASNRTMLQLVNGDFTASDFRLIIHGVVENPAVVIGGHTYQVNATINEGDYVTIDSQRKTITLTRSDGSTENLFNSRNRNSYIFEKIPVGESQLLLSGEFSIEIILLEERSEPKWI